jgi:PPOX class probable F420-dependent enzyme
MRATLGWDWKQRRFVRSARVGRLATADAAGRPHAVPICFALASDTLYTAIDLKPKREKPENLQRLRNVAQNPEVAVIVDRYSEDWKRLAFVLLRGRASLARAEEAQRAMRLLRLKYPQYRAMPIKGRPILKIRLTSVYSWGAV